MFEFLFQYPRTAFLKGSVTLLGTWPVWILVVAILLAAAGLAWLNWRRHADEDADRRMPALRRGAIWGLQCLMVALLLLLLWRPAITVTTLKPQQNIVAVVVDDSESMAIEEDGKSRASRAVELLNGGLLNDLGEKFQTRLYRMGGRAERIEKLETLSASEPVSRIGDALKQVAAESTSLPIGAVLLLSDGADNSGGIDLATISEIRSRRIPVHTVGFGREQMRKDVELTDMVVPQRALADSRLNAQVTLRHRGYGGQKVRLVLQESGKVLAAEQITLNDGSELQTASLYFNAGLAGAKNLRVAADLLPGEENTRNNALTRLLNVEDFKPRILMIDGNPRWEFKFIRRSVEEDRTLKLHSMVRTTQNKIYRQVDSPGELEHGYPGDDAELFGYQGLIIGDVEAGYFTPKQLELIKRFADKRGGGVLFLGGMDALTEGGYHLSPLAEMMPVALPSRKGTFHRERAMAELTQAGRDSLICRLEETPEKNAERWSNMPELASYQEVGELKPGALELLRVRAPGGRSGPLLVTQNYGRGRVALFATGGSWRWQMLQDSKDLSHEMFWQQMLRWLVADTPGRVWASTPKQVLSDERRLLLRAEVRDKSFEPVLDASVEARIMGPDGLAAQVELSPRQDEPGVYTAEWTAEPSGGYLTEVLARRGGEEIGQDRLVFRREDGVAENFHTEQNRELLENLADRTGGTYRKPDDLGNLLESISYSEAGVTVRETKDLWNIPAVFLALLGLRGIEWLLRRKWGRI